MSIELTTTPPPARAASHAEPSACMGCGTVLSRSFVDLGSTPLANAYLDAAGLAIARAGGEPTFPLHVRVCDDCLLVQIDELVPREAMFSDYAYFSSYSDSWLAHSRAYVDRVVRRLGLGAESLVIEVASNDGYLLREVDARGVPSLGIEPAANVAEVARASGIDTLVEFFDIDLARRLVAEGRRADLLVANNVLAHNADINAFVGGMAEVLAPRGVVTVEAPHLLRLVEDVQFDTIYHEHVFYLSLHAMERVFERHGLVVFDVDVLTTHGGSLRYWACRPGTAPIGPSVGAVLAAERAAGLHRPEGYDGFAPRVAACRSSLRSHLDAARERGERVVGYGAAAKGNTLLNVCGVTDRDLAYVVDRSPHKQDRFLPGSHLPVRAPEVVFDDRPDELLLLAWNLRDEIMSAMAGIRSWGGRFATPVPLVEVHP
jgi:SAM-dependent methyltransferase